MEPRTIRTLGMVNATSLAITFLLGSFVSCGASEKKTRDPALSSVTTRESETTSTAFSGAAPTELTSGVVDGGAKIERWSDDQVLQVVHVINAAEVEQAKLAEGKARDPRVKRYAELMLRDHLESDRAVYDLTKKHSLNPVESDASTWIATDNRRAVTDLAFLMGGDFDRGYIDAQVREHDTVLSLLDGKLIPNAQSPEIRTYLETVRGRVAHHLEEAKSLQKSLPNK